MSDKEKIPSAGGEISEGMDALASFVRYVKERIIREDCNNEEFSPEYREKLRVLYEKTFDDIIDIIENRER